MGRYGKKTRLSCEKVIEKAKNFFGSGDVGLAIKECEKNCARSEDESGHVFITCCTDNEEAEIDLETREWDYQVKQFMREI